jgi:hypothetical protein
MKFSYIYKHYNKLKARMINRTQNNRLMMSLDNSNVNWTSKFQIKIWTQCRIATDKRGEMEKKKAGEVGALWDGIAVLSIAIPPHRIHQSA